MSQSIKNVNSDSGCAFIDKKVRWLGGVFILKHPSLETTRRPRPSIPVTKQLVEMGSLPGEETPVTAMLAGLGLLGVRALRLAAESWLLTLCCDMLLVGRDGVISPLRAPKPQHTGGQRYSKGSQHKAGH